MNKNTMHQTGGDMSGYRCYCLDRHGCIRAVTALAAESDERARADAATLLAACEHDVAEIWHGRRRVCTIEGVHRHESDTTGWNTVERRLI